MSPLLVAIVCACINGLLAAMCSNTALTDADRAVITNKHNALRSSLARGTARTNSGNAPGGSNIYKLVRSTLADDRL
uniref:SCP domain-containing protein n=1 Tax=Plectus sambesii TaxID=2011161 RepID=A0A914UWB8_9BILA